MICNAKVMVSFICVLLSHVHDINFYHLLGNWHHLLLEDYLDTIFILDTLVFVSACSNLLVKLTRHWCILLPWCIKEKMKKRLNPYASASVYSLVLCLFLLQFNYLFFQKIPSHKSAKMTSARTKEKSNSLAKEPILHLSMNLLGVGYTIQEWTKTYPSPLVDCM